MKDTVYPHLSALLGVSVELCDKIRTVSLPISSKAVSDSEAHRDKCIEEADKSFILVFDKEDVVYLALRLHRLNVRLCTLAKLTEAKGRGFEPSETAPILEHTKAICLKLSDIFERKFKRKKCRTNEGLSPTFTADLPHYSNKYNFYSVISDYTLFRTASECSEEAECILDYTVRTLIKNS